MPINAQCPGCGQTLSVGDEFAGAQGKCPTCGTLVTFHAGGAAPPPPAYPPPVAAPGLPPYAPAGPGGMPGYAPPAPLGPPRDNTELFTLLGLGGAGFSLFLLLISTFLGWGPGREGSVGGLRFGDGRMVFCLSLLLGALIGLSFLRRPLVPLAVVLAGSFGTFLFVVMFSGVFSGYGGYILGLLGAMGLMGTCIWTAMRFPLGLEAPIPAAQSAFIRTYGMLLGTQTLALVLGVLYWIIIAMTLIGAAGGMPSGMPSGGLPKGL